MIKVRRYNPTRITMPIIAMSCLSFFMGKIVANMVSAVNNHQQQVEGMPRFIPDLRKRRFKYEKIFRFRNILGGSHTNMIRIIEEV